jgi:hypothetical protein
MKHFHAVCTALFEVETSSAQGVPLSMHLSWVSLHSATGPSPCSELDRPAVVLTRLERSIIIISLIIPRRESRLLARDDARCVMLSHPPLDRWHTLLYRRPHDQVESIAAAQTTSQLSSSLIRTPVPSKAPSGSPYSLQHHV